MKSFEELISIIQTLRGENGCAWDKVQTFDSLIPCFLAFKLGMKKYQSVGSKRVKYES